MYDHHSLSFNLIGLIIGTFELFPGSLRGIGDLLLTATSSKSRNFRFGKEIGRGLPSLKARERIKTVVEVFGAIENARALCLKHGIAAPVIDSIRKIIYKGCSPASILEAAGFGRD